MERHLKNEGLGVDIPSHFKNMAEIAFLSDVDSFYGKISDQSFLKEELTFSREIKDTTLLAQHTLP